MNSVIKASGLLVNLEQRLEKGAAGVFSPRFFVVVVEGWNAMGSWWNPWDIACMNGIFTDPWMVGPLIFYGKCRLKKHPYMDGMGNEILIRLASKGLESGG